MKTNPCVIALASTPNSSASTASEYREDLPNEAITPLAGARYPSGTARHRIVAIKQHTGVKISTIMERALDLGLRALESDLQLLIQPGITFRPKDQDVLP